MRYLTDRELVCRRVVL